MSRKLLLVEDDLGIRELILLYLEKRGYHVIQAENGKQALAILEKKNPQLILLDIEMPEVDGFEVCRKVRERSDVPIIFISNRRDILDKLKSFELGGDDYLTKPFDFAELEARIKSNLNRYQKLKRELSTDVLQYEDLEIHLNTYECFINGEKIKLSAKEMKLLMLLAKRPNQVFKAEQIYDYIWGLESTGDHRTVKVHIRNLRRKIERNPNKPKYIVTVRGFGYRFQH